MMSFVVTNLPNNDFAVNNSVYLPRSKKGAPTVKINEKYFKCAFAEEMEPNKIGLSKNIRDYLGIELNQAVKVEPFQAANIEELDLSYLELELTQMKPKIEG